MAPIVFKPENALKRAEELIQVNQPMTALQGLHELIMSRKFKYSQVNLESIVMKYLQLSVELRKGKMAREALAQYRYHTQHNNLQSLQTVIKYFLDASNENLQSILAKASDLPSESIDDLEEYETPDVIFMKTVYGTSSEESKEKTERDNILSALRFRWEVFRICLDLTKNNPNLELLAQEFSKSAFDFCLKYNRKSEFRRLCDILRGYLNSLTSNVQTGKTHASLESSLSLLIDVRFDQLATAIALELWQEAFRSIEDLHGLLVLYKKNIKTSSMIQYYESLVKIFHMSGDALFHSAAWNKLLVFVFSLLEAPPVEQVQMYCSSAVLAALSIPAEYRHIEAEGMAEEDDTDDVVEGDRHTKSKDIKYTSLLGLSSVPDREELIKHACSKQYWKFVAEPIKELVAIVQKTTFTENDARQFFILSRQIESISIQYTPFLGKIRRSMAFRYLQQLSMQRSEISFEELSQLTGEFFEVKSRFELESFLFSLNRHPNTKMLARVDYRSQIVSFVPAWSTKLSSYTNNGSKSYVDMEALLQDVTALLTQLLQKDIPEGLLDLQDKIRLFQEQLEDSRCILQIRQRDYNARKVEQDLQRIRKDQEEAANRQARLEQEREQEKIRREEENKKRELHKHLREREELERVERLKLIEEVNKKLASMKRQLDPHVYVDMTKGDILREQARLLDEAKKDLDKRWSAIAKRMDYKERSLRLCEIPLLEQQASQNQKEQAILTEKRIDEKRQALSLQRGIKMKKIASAQQLLDSRQAFLSFRQEQINAKSSEKQKQLQEQLNTAKEKYKQQILEQRYKQAVEAEKEEKLRKLDEIARKQRQIELEIEQSLNAKKNTPTAVTGESKATIPVEPKVSAVESTEAPKPSGGKFVPSYKKKQN